MERKTERVHIMISKTELEEVKKKAKELGMNVSMYFRLKALGKI